MTGPTDGPDVPLDPARSEAVRRALTDARHTDPIPEHVAARLDRVLDGLARERTEAAPPDTTPAVPAPVGSLEEGRARRRRRTAASVLVAAAAVVVAGVGVSTLTDGGLEATISGESQDSGADGGADVEEAPGAAADEDGPAAGGQDYLPTPQPVAPQATRLARLAEVDDRDLAGEARELAAQAPTLVDGQVLDRSKSTAAWSYATKRACLTAGTGEQVAAVTYQGELATLVFRVPEDDVRRVDLFRCDLAGDEVDARFVRSVAIPWP